MVNAVALGCLLALPFAPDAKADDPSRAVDAALGKVAPKWYDASKGSVRPVAIPIDPKDRTGSGSGPALARSRGFGLNNILPIAALVAGLAALLGVLAWYWRLYQPAPAELGPAPRGPGVAHRVEELPEALRGASDPWQEAIRLRDRGELGAAVVRLFAHQLLTLSRLGLVRLAPGRTGRQLVRSVSDLGFRGLSTPTLRAFESVFYGHRDPTPAEFAALWAVAEDFERRAASPGVAP